MNIQQHLYTSQVILQEICKNRGFNINDSIIELEDIHNTCIPPYTSCLELMSFKIESERQLIIKYIIKDNELNKIIDEIIDESKITDDDDIIIVCCKTITSEKRIDIENEYNNVRIFNLIELQYNIIDNQLVPNHTSINLEESQILQNQYIKDNLQLPVLSYNDPVARYYGYRLNDIIKIKRKLGHTFRIVKHISLEITV